MKKFSSSCVIAVHGFFDGMVVEMYDDITWPFPVINIVYFAGSNATIVPPYFGFFRQSTHLWTKTSKGLIGGKREIQNIYV